MATRIRLSHSPSQRQRISATAHLAQTMALIALPAAELESAVATELAENPALELLNERHCPSCGRKLKDATCPACTRPTDNSDGPIVYLSARTRSRGEYRSDADEDGRDYLEPPEPEKLAEHVLRQIAPMLPAEDRHVAAYLLMRLDEHGFLPEAPVESAIYLRVSMDRVEFALH